jgi:hypothetical protein
MFSSLQYEKSCRTHTVRRNKIRQRHIVDRRAARRQGAFAFLLPSRKASSTHGLGWVVAFQPDTRTPRLAGISEGPPSPTTPHPPIVLLRDICLLHLPARFYDPTPLRLWNVLSQAAVRVGVSVRRRRLYWRVWSYSTHYRTFRRRPFSDLSRLVKTKNQRDRTAMAPQVTPGDHQVKFRCKCACNPCKPPSPRGERFFHRTHSPSPLCLGC